MIDINTQELTANIGYMADIFQDISIAMGLGLVMNSLFHFYRYGQTRGNYMAYQMTVAKPLLVLVGGIFLLCLPTTVTTFLLNFWSSSSPMQYTATTDGWEQILPPIIMFVKFIGICAFTRGCLLFSRAGHEQSHPGNISKALLHIIGGISCVNIVGTSSLLSKILGIE